MAVTKRKIIKYAILPEILPRIGTLFGTGFAHVAYLVALIFQSVRLIPANHPYVNSENLGRFAIRHVISEASRNLKFDRHHIDQIFIFFTILIGLVLLIFQIVLIAVAFISQPVLAATFVDWFTLSTGNPNYPFDETNDIALMALDRVFGVEGIFNSCISTGVGCTDHNGNITLGTNSGFLYPNALHLALHDLFHMYSIGISIISIMIIAYFIITIIGETAVTGTPFGQRFNRTWAPVRLILFFALLAPLNIGGQNEGLNGAQLITLWTAKFGSNFASNAWGRFNTTTARAYYQPEQLIAIPEIADVGNMAQFFTIANACIIGERMAYNNDVQFYLVRDNRTVPAASNSMAFYMTGAGTMSISADDAILFSEGEAPLIVIGIHDPVRYPDYKGGVKPVCGEVFLPITTLSEVGARAIFSRYWAMIGRYLPSGTISSDYYQDIRSLASCTVNRTLPDGDFNCIPTNPYGSYLELVAEHLDSLRTSLRNNIIVSINEHLTTADFSVSDDLVGRGWAGAAIWYNRIAQMNGAITAAAYDRPTVKSWPIVMENVKRQQLSSAPSVIGHMQYNPSLSNNEIARHDRPRDDELANAYYSLYKIWDDNAVIADPDTALTGNAFIDTINTIFGTAGLFNLRRPATTAPMALPAHSEVHPLALLSSLGRSMVQAAVINLGSAAGATIGGGLLSILKQFTSAQIMLSTAGNFLKAAAASTIMIGFMLGYILPFMPFMYFFFALGGWIKSIFEAMVAMPLWALSHLRIDGQGVVGPGATNGYFLIFEIFLRPILILIGLIASVLIFGVMVQVLNNVFDVMITNVGGNDRSNTATPTDIEFYRGPIDQLFYSIIYAAVAYMVGLSCFKMIDQIPNKILRWIGVSVETFKDAQGDPAGKLASSTYQKGNMAVGQVSGAFDQNAGRLAAMMR